MDSRCHGPLFPALLLAAVFGIAAPVAATAQSRSNVDLFIDLAGEDAGEAMRTGVAPSGIAIEGIPLKLGVAEDSAAEGWHMVAGARGRHVFALDRGFDMVARGNATRTTFIDDPAQDRAGAFGATEFRLQRGDWQFGLTPGIAATRWAGGAVQRDGTLDGRLARPITENLGITASGRYRWRVADGTEAFHSEALGGRIGFNYRLPAVRLELAYGARQELWSDGSGYGGPDATLARGPALSAALPLDRALKLNAGYSFTETTSHGIGGVDAAESTDELHQLSFGLVWDIGGAASDVALSFRYRYEHANIENGTDHARHAGTVNLALGF